MRKFTTTSLRWWKNMANRSLQPTCAGYVGRSAEFKRLTFILNDSFGEMRLTAVSLLRSCGKIRHVTTSHQADRWYATATRLYSDHGRLSWPATELEIRDAALQFVRKLSGLSVPSRANEVAFEQAVAEVAEGRQPGFSPRCAPWRPRETPHRRAPGRPAAHRPSLKTPGRRNAAGRSGQSRVWCGPSGSRRRCPRSATPAA